MQNYITLDEAISQELKEHPELKAAYQKELLINGIASMLVTMRRQANLTSAELAKRAVIAPSVIARLESGCNSRMPSLGLLARVANAVHATLKISFAMKKC